MAPSERPTPTLFDAAEALLGLVVVLFSIAGSFLALFVSVGVVMGWNVERWVALAPGFFVTSLLPFLLNPHARTLAATPLSILAPLRPWERPWRTHATLARVCTTTYWCILTAAAFAPEHLTSTAFLAVHAAHILGWPSTFWMAALKPNPHPPTR